MSLALGLAVFGDWFPKRRSTISEHPEYPAPALMLVLVAHVLSDRLDVVHTDDATPDEPSVVRLEKCRRGERLQNRPGGTFGHEWLLARCETEVTPRMGFKYR